MLRNAIKTQKREIMRGKTRKKRVKSSDRYVKGKEEGRGGVKLFVTRRFIG